MSDYPPIQIVDKDDKPVGGADMMEVYENGLIHRVAYIWVENSAGQVLLQKRSMNVVNFPGRWDVSAAGHVDEGENYVQAAKRELKEELGITGFEPLEADSFYQEVEVDGRLLKRFTKVFKLKVPTGLTFKPQAEEVSELKWATPAEIRELAKSYPDKVALGLTASLKSL